MRLRFHRVPPVAPALFIFHFAIAASAPAQDYRLTALGSLGGEYSWASGINDAGDVVGSSLTERGPAHRAFLWRPGSEMRDLGTLGGQESHARAINNAGQVVGSADTVDGLFHAFLWDSTRGMQDLGTLGGDESAALAINDEGQVVGWADNGDTRRAFIWDPVNGMREIPTPTEHGARATAINNAAVVVGAYETGEVFEIPAVAWGPFPIEAAFLYDGEQVTDLGRFGETGFWDRTLLHGINNNGVIVGNASHYEYDLPDLGPALVLRGTGFEGIILPRDARFGSATAINNRSQIVGYFRFFIEDGSSFAFHYDGETAVDLQDRFSPSEGWRLTGAVDINESGQIVCGAQKDHQQQYRAVLLTPITADPSPTNPDPSPNDPDPPPSNPAPSPTDPTPDPIVQAAPAATCPFAAAMILGTSLAGLLLTKRRGAGRAD